MPMLLAHCRLGASTTSRFLAKLVAPAGSWIVPMPNCDCQFESERFRRCLLAHIRVDLISLVRNFEGPSLVRRPLQTCHAPNLIGRFPRRLHLHCGGQLVPRKCSRHCAADDCEFGGRKPIESCVDGAETQMSCRLAVISGLCLFTSKRCVLS